MIRMWDVKVKGVIAMVDVAEEDSRDENSQGDY